MQSEKYCSLAILSIVLLRASKAAVAIAPCFIMTIDLSLECGGRGIELLISSNIAPRFEDIEHKETCLPDLSLISEEGFIALTYSTVMLYSQPR